MGNHTTDQLFWLLLVLWIIGAGSLAYLEYREEREYKATKLKAGLVAGAWLTFWWLAYAWQAWWPALKRWWSNDV